jgi:hypothetical protein
MEDGDMNVRESPKVRRSAWRLRAHSRVIAGSLVAVVLGAAATTWAGLNEFSDGFEGDPWSRWEGLAEGDGVAGADIDQGLAHYGKNNGWLFAGHGWAAERIGVSVGQWADRSICMAEIWMRPVGGGATVGLQVWNPDGWHLIAETYPWLDGTSYQRVLLLPFSLEGLDKVYVQAIFGNHTGDERFVRIDDMVLRCG